jgi:Holliday junction resolvase RusA-like endonuclease
MDPQRKDGGLSAPPRPDFFTVGGVPTTKNKRVAFVVGGVARVAHTKDTKAKVARFSAVAEAHAPTAPWGGPITLSFGFYFPVAKSWPKWRRALALAGRLSMTSKPDTSRLTTFAEDCLAGLYFCDDSQVVEIQAGKAYSERPRTEVLVTYHPTDPQTKRESESHAW